jgi:hypothetical protein
MVVKTATDGPLLFTINFVDAAANAGATASTTTDVYADQGTSNILLDTTMPTLTSVTIRSNNDALDTIATDGDRIDLAFVSDEEIYKPSCELFSGGEVAMGQVNVTIATFTGIVSRSTRAQVDGVIEWMCTYIVRTTNSSAGIAHSAGPVTFKLNFYDLAGNKGPVTSKTMGSLLKVFDPCFGYYCMHKDVDYGSIFERVQPACSIKGDCKEPSACKPSTLGGSWFDNGDGLALNPYVDTHMTCNSGHPHVSVTQTCEYGPSYSFLGKYCMMCPHPNVVNAQRTTCTPCTPGSGPSVSHDECLQCLSGTFSPFGVCEPCPMGATNSDDYTTCIDVDECETMNGGCDIIAGQGMSCKNEPFTGVGYECGICPVGFLRDPKDSERLSDQAVSRLLTHDIQAINLTVASRISGSHCTPPSSPPIRREYFPPSNLRSLPITLR